MSQVDLMSISNHAIKSSKTFKNNQKKFKIEMREANKIKHHDFKLKLKSR